MVVPDPAERPTMTVDETASVLGVSRSTAYESIRTGDIPSIRLGRRLVVPTAAVRKMLQLDSSDESVSEVRTV